MVLMPAAVERPIAAEREGNDELSEKLPHHVSCKRLAQGWPTLGELRSRKEQSANCSATLDPANFAGCIPGLVEKQLLGNFRVERVTLPYSACLRPPASKTTDLKSSVRANTCV